MGESNWLLQSDLFAADQQEEIREKKEKREKGEREERHCSDKY